MKRKCLWSVLIALSLLLFSGQSLAGGYTGMWWDPDFNGSGVTIHQEGTAIFGGWYFYDGSGAGTWVTFEGTLSDNTLTTTFKRFSGPPFGGAWVPGQVVGTETGSLTLTFHSTSSATFAYSLDGSSGTLALQRFGNQTSHVTGYYVGQTIPSSPMSGDYVCESRPMVGAIYRVNLAGYLVDSSGGIFELRATVSQDGSISNGVAREYFSQAQVGAFSGTANGFVASGIYSEVNGCTGTWSATAQ